MRNESAGKADGEVVGAESTALLSSELFIPHFLLPTPYFPLPTSHFPLTSSQHCFKRAVCRRCLSDGAIL